MSSNHSATAAVTDPYEWHRIGLAHLQAGRTDEAVHALEEAERRGYADAAAMLGTAYRRLGRQADAERAYLRALERTSRPEVRRRAAERLAHLYSDLGSPRAHAAVLQYLGGLRGSLLPPVPQSCVRQTPTGGYVVDDRHGLIGKARRWWRRLPRWGRAGTALISGLGSLLTAAEGVRRAIEVLH
jgi:tetratricopeptide (TPR) repeat protein